MDAIERQSSRMRRVPPGRFYDFEPCVLFLDDLERIVELVRAVSAHVTIAADDHEFDAVQDMTLLAKPSAEDVKIQGDGGGQLVYFEVRAYLARLYLSNSDDLKLKGLAAAVSSVVEGRKVKKPLGRKRFSVLLGKSTDPRPAPPPSWAARNRELVAATVGGLVGALATAALTVLLIWLGVLKAGGGA